MRRQTTKPLRLGSLFSGIGGFELAASWLGWEIAWTCEILPYPSAVLARHWPAAPNLGDITRVDWAAVERPDVLCGGFPCQDVSNAGKRAGIGGERSGLWREFARAIGTLRPRYIVVENVAALLSPRRGFGAVLGDLAALGYDAEWQVISAADVGAPHLRERVWIIAAPRPFPDSLERAVWELRQWIGQQQGEPRPAVARYDGAQRRVADADGSGPAHTAEGDARGKVRAGRDATGGCRGALADADGGGCFGLWEPEHAGEPSASRVKPDGRGTRRRRPRPVPDAERDRLERELPAGPAAPPTDGPGGWNRSDWWGVEPGMGRVVNGFPSRVDRLKTQSRLEGIGNAIVPGNGYAVLWAIQQAETYNLKGRCQW
jgi:DNA (cytosine-5)-methyltransferase 1